MHPNNKHVHVDLEFRTCFLKSLVEINFQVDAECTWILTFMCISSCVCFLPIFYVFDVTRDILSEHAWCTRLMVCNLVDFILFNCSRFILDATLNEEQCRYFCFVSFFLFQIIAVICHLSDWLIWGVMWQFWTWEFYSFYSIYFSFISPDMFRARNLTLRREKVQQHWQLAEL